MQKIQFILNIFVVKTADGLKWISDQMKLCSPLKNAADVVTLKGYLSNLWTNVAMMDYPYPTSFLMPLPGNPVAVRFILTFTLK